MTGGVRAIDMICIESEIIFSLFFPNNCRYSGQETDSKIICELLSSSSVRMPANGLSSSLLPHATFVKKWVESVLMLVWFHTISCCCIIYIYIYILSMCSHTLHMFEATAARYVSVSSIDLLNDRAGAIFRSTSSAYLRWCCRVLIFGRCSFRCFPSVGGRFTSCPCLRGMRSLLQRTRLN